MKKYVENMKEYEENMKEYKGNRKKYVGNMKKYVALRPRSASRHIQINALGLGKSSRYD